MIIKKYNLIINKTDTEINPFTSLTDAKSFYGFDTTVAASAATSYQEEDCFLLMLHKNIKTEKVSLLIVLDAANTKEGNCSFTIKNVPDDTIVSLSDDSGEYSRDKTTINCSYSWDKCCTDGLVLDNVYSNLSIDVLSTTLTKIKVVDSNGTASYFDINKTVTLSISDVDLSSNIVLTPPPSIYKDKTTIEVLFSSNVQNYIDSNTDAPTLAKYIAYDNLTPKNPFIATVQDGKGNIIFDGGFPKWYNTNYNTGWSAFSELSASFKYLYNAINFIIDKKKIKTNKEILIIGNANTNDHYCVKNTTSTGFKTSIDKVCSLIGLNPTYKTRSDYTSNILDFNYTELNQYNCILFFSTLYTSSKLITDDAIQSLLAFRENGGGIFFITDHGDNITTLDSAKNSTYSGFFRTANQIITNFGCWFSGNYNRSPVNVGYLRDNYGDHPLYNNLSDDDDIYAGASESRIFIKETSLKSIDTTQTVQLSNNGFTTFKFLVVLKNGEVNTESFTYGLNTEDLIILKDEFGNSYPNNFETIKNNLTLNVFINPTVANDFSKVSGFIKKNSSVLGELLYIGTNQTSFYGNNTIQIKNGDKITVSSSIPFDYSKSINIISPDSKKLKDTKSLSKYVKFINFGEVLNSFANNRLIKVMNYLNLNTYLASAKNKVMLDKYFNNELLLPDIDVLIYDDASSTDSALSSKKPPSFETIFNTWGIYSVSKTEDVFYKTKAEAPDKKPFNTWTFDESLNTIKQTENTGPGTGFVSPNTLSKYVFECTISSSNGDDDVVGLVISYNHTSSGSKFIAVYCTSGGWGNKFGPLNIVTYGIDSSNTQGWDGVRLLAKNDHDSVDGGWSNKKKRIKIIRDDNLITVYATKWDDLDNYDPKSKITVDLNTPELQELNVPGSYGYCTESQANSFYIDSKLIGGQDFTTIINFKTNTIYKYNVAKSVWEKTGFKLQDIYGYPRIINNPETGKSYKILENEVIEL